MVKIKYKYTDANGIINRNCVKLKNLEIAKYFILAGAGSVPQVDTLRKALAVLTYYESYFPDDEGTEFFHKPTGWEYDPTQVAHFSNLIGKALADKFFKLLVGGIISYNYEAVMEFNNILIQGSRPDLYGFSKSHSYVAIEAKGYSQKTYKKAKIKEQSKSGPLYKNYSIASVTENIYSDISVDFYDPFYETNSSRINEGKFVEDYYKELNQYLKFEDLRKINHDGDEFIIIGSTFFKGDLIYLVVSSSTLKAPSLQERFPKYNENYFIDCDGIGVFKDCNNFEFVNYKQNEN